MIMALTTGKGIGPTGGHYPLVTLLENALKRTPVAEREREFKRETLGISLVPRRRST